MLEGVATARVDGVGAHERSVMTDNPQTTASPPEGEAAAGEPAAPATPDVSEQAFAELKARLQEQLNRLRALARDVALSASAQLDADASIAETALGTLEPESRKKRRRREQVRRLERLVERLAAVEVDTAHGRARDLKIIARSLRRALRLLTEQ